MRKHKEIAAVCLMAFLWLAAFYASQFTAHGIIAHSLVFELIPGNDVIAIVLLGIISFAFLAFAIAMNRGIVIGLIVFLFVGLLPLNGSLWFARDYSRNERMKELKRGLDELQAKERLPATLDDTPFLRKYSAGFFGIDQIDYRAEGKNYTIQSYCVPAGPFELYSSERTEWYYEE